MFTTVTAVNGKRGWGKQCEALKGIPSRLKFTQKGAHWVILLHRVPCCFFFFQQSPYIRLTIDYCPQDTGRTADRRCRTVVFSGQPSKGHRREFSKKATREFPGGQVVRVEWASSTASPDQLSGLLIITSKFLTWASEGLPGGSHGKESACSAGDPGSIPMLGRSPGEGNGYPLPYSCLENSMEEWRAIVHGL